MRGKAIERRLEDLTQRMRAKRSRPLVVVDTLGWEPADRDAYRFGDEETRAELIEKHHGPLPEHEPGSLEITALIVSLTPMRTEETAG